MTNIDDFFSSRNSINHTEQEFLDNQPTYLEAFKAMARTTYNSIYVIDYQNKKFEYVSDNPLFLCGHSANEVQEMGYAFYFKYVVESDLDLLLRINNIGFEYYEGIPIEQRKEYIISYDFHIRNQNDQVILINQKLTPIMLDKNGRMWKALCIVSLSSERSSGNIRIFKNGENVFAEYNEEGNFWMKSAKVILTDREKDILHYSVRGLTINGIAEKLFLSPDTIKFHRRKLFDKLDVSNISEAISYVVSNKLI
ncbi:response regulator transcription factor [Saccharicrinis aurantiacus]|uniref:response regulator transcription factor n=1 Tax=Saccharicrinis aurantiacus TaxID=1849719 RepID=UPI00094F8776|nr:LuxR C-terminal-related transcriptional regulator [Saccharicrinis aurantiacus]